MSTVNFKHFAIGYLNDWCDSDQHFVNGLGTTGSEEDRLKWLSRAANYYKVNRTLRRIPEERRYGRALEAIDSINGEVTIETVDDIVLGLERTFGIVRQSSFTTVRRTTH